jgi:hypothetical protein
MLSQRQDSILSMALLELLILFSWIFLESLELTAIFNDNFSTGRSGTTANPFDSSDDFHAVHDRSKDHVLSIKPRGFGGTQKELASIGTRSSVGHGQNTRSRVLQNEVLIRKLGTVDGLSTRTVVVGEVTTLAHESGNHTVEGRALEAKALFSGAKSAKILSRLWDDVGSKLHGDTPRWLSANGDIKVSLGIGPAKEGRVIIVRRRTRARFTHSSLFTLAATAAGSG